MDPLLKPYSPLEQVRVLKAVRDKCGTDGLRMQVLANIEGDEKSLSKTLELLTELKYIESATWECMDGTHYYPVKITREGLLFLESGNKEFWDLAEKLFLESLDQLAPVKVSTIAELCRSCWKMVAFERVTP